MRRAVLTSDAEGFAKLSRQNCRFAIIGAILMLAFLVYPTVCNTVVMYACRYMLQSIYRADKLADKEESPQHTK